MVALPRHFGPLITVALLAGCAAAPSSGPGGPSAAERAPASADRINRTLVMAGRSEVPSLGSRPLRQFGLTSTTVTRLFNAGLALRDGEGTFHPYLAEALPELNTDSWKVFPDGRMETMYRLRSGLAWQDGTPLTADDFVFSLGVYVNPEVGQAGQAPIAMMEQVLAPDPRTVIIRWRQVNADAGNLDAGSGGNTNPTGFPPLPRHLLERQLQEGNIDAFAALPFWNTGYVGLGPYRIDRWEVGSYFEAVAYDQHVLGRPKINRVRMLFIPDFNTSLANMLAGEAHITVDDSIRFQQALVLRQEWGPKQAGTVLVYPALWRHAHIQQRPELARPAALIDARVRKALMYSVDKQELSQTLFEGEGILTDTPIPTTSLAFPDVDRAATKYPHDVHRAEQLMGEVGYVRGADGVWTHPTQGRFALGLDTFQSPQNENEMHIMAASWREAGFEVGENVLAANLSSDAQLRDTRPGVVAASAPPGEAALAEHTSSLVPSAQNRWTGVNRGGWTNPEFDRLAQQFNATLARDQRAAVLVQMARVFTEDAAVISLYFNPTTTAFAATLRGPRPAVPEGTMAWDIHTWEWVA
jgi:peptide/nickel transport system substrate-binding protein